MGSNRFQFSQSSPPMTVFRRLLSPGLGILLGSAFTLWLGTAVFTPPPAIAYTSRVSIFLTRDDNESFEGLVRRAEITARAAVQRSFDADLLTTEAVVTIVGENQGISVPILTVEVTRDQWRSRPDVQYWTRYYDTAAGLLGI
jgi:hypothetical protein